MPRLSDSMEEGTILKWLKSDGEEVTRGEALAEIETDKATMTYEADADGPLRILAQEGTTLPIGQPIARIGDVEVTAPAAQAPAPAPMETPPAAPVPRSNGDGRVKASPVARRMAQEEGIDLHALEGSGPGGRIVKADVHAARPAPAEPAFRAPAEPGGRTDVRTEELSRTQQLVARRMTESRATVPDFSLQTEVDMGRAVALRAQIKEAAGAAGVTPSFNDMVVKASALALREHPRANGAYKDGRFELYERVNVGVAVAAEDSLVVPTLFDADRKSLGQLAREARAAAERVRSGEVTPPELSGGTFTVSNLGMYGIVSFTAVINPPQAAILAVGVVRAVPVVEEGQIVPGHRMSITLACDHRILYGAPAAKFLARVRELLEHPLALAL